MRLGSERKSRNIEDRRGRGGPVGTGVKVGGGMAILALLAALLLGEDPLRVLEQLGGGSAPAPQADVSPQAGAGTDAAGDFVSRVLADTEDTWGAVFEQEGARYQEPTLVLFDRAVQSACGFASAATGPFYCPGDRKVYLDTSFFRELQRLGAPGDFAAAYVIAHEVGHHVQTLTGTAQRVRQAQQQSSQRVANDLSVRMELQADCFAGVWGHYAQRQGLLEPGDVEEGLRAAAAIGDDRLQEMAGRRVQPESFTHGSSEQRVAWFRRGFETGDADQCDTFG